MTLDDFEMPKPVDYHLENGEKLHAEYPDTFGLPKRSARENLKVGDIVKLIFVLNDPDPSMPGAERMWVTVSAGRGSNYVGELNNEPALVQGAKVGDFIEFGPEHVIDIYEE